MHGCLQNLIQSEIGRVTGDTATAILSAIMAVRQRTTPPMADRTIRVAGDLTRDEMTGILSSAQIAMLNPGVMHTDSQRVAIDQRGIVHGMEAADRGSTKKDHGEIAGLEAAIRRRETEGGTSGGQSEGEMVTTGPIKIEDILNGLKRAVPVEGRALLIGEFSSWELHGREAQLNHLVLRLSSMYLTVQVSLLLAYNLLEKVLEY